jgi:lipopolysaccharide/colanic/teichoic acid biosynthesis glycosyltransferase
MDSNSMLRQPVYQTDVGTSPALVYGLDADAAFEVGPAPAHALSKRTFDVLVSATLLLLLLPLIGLLVLLILVDSPGKVFFRSQRVGYGGRALQMLKFRKMHPAASGPALTVHDDARFTRVGFWLARSKLDELPQLWHVLRGEMSIVGPRPEARRFVERNASEYRHIIQMRPGIVGFAQIAFASESRVLDARDPVGHYVEDILPQKIHLDKLYAERWSFWLDLKISFWAAVAVLLRRSVAVHRTDGRMSLRRR